MLRAALTILPGLLAVAPGMSSTTQQRPADATPRSAQQGHSHAAPGADQQRSGDAASQPEPQRPGVDEWQVYRNDKYGYEIRYPPSHEVWPTGVFDIRDGRSIRVARRAFAAPSPFLDIFALRDPAYVEELAWGETADLDVETEDVEVGGVAARVVHYRWKSNGELFLVEMRLRNMFVRYRVAPGVRDERGSVWWKIMTSLRPLDG